MGQTPFSILRGAAFAGGSLKFKLVACTYCTPLGALGCYHVEPGPKVWPRQARPRHPDQTAQLRHTLQERIANGSCPDLSPPRRSFGQL